MTFGDDKVVYKVDGACNKYVDEVEKYNWPTPMVIEIMQLESSCDPDAVNAHDKHEHCYGSYSLLQVSCEDYKKGMSKKDPVLNIKLAYDLFLANHESFRPWSTCRLLKNCL